MNYYGKAETAANRILELFRGGDVPKALAPIFIRRRDNVPCRAWSWSNQLLTALAGHSDAQPPRGKPRENQLQSTSKADDCRRVVTVAMQSPSLLRVVRPQTAWQGGGKDQTRLVIGRDFA